MQILEKHNLDYTVVEYLKNLPSKDDLIAISKALNLNPDKFIRKGEKAYKNLNIQDFLNDSEKLYSLIIENPILLERPIIIKGERGVIGRPPENILTLI